MVECVVSASAVCFLIRGELVSGEDSPSFFNALVGRNGELARNVGCGADVDGAMIIWDSRSTFKKLVF